MWKYILKNIIVLNDENNNLEIFKKKAKSTFSNYHPIVYKQTIVLIVSFIRELFNQV